jgi:hypothetical protein
MGHSGANQKELVMNAETATESLRTRPLSGDDLLRAGRSLSVLAITVIVLLSAGVLVLAFTQWVESGQMEQMLQTQGRAVYGFGLLMLLTVGYLVGKGLSTARDQRVMIAQLLDEESISRARRLDPVLEYHHPELCREILLRQSHYAGRIHSAVSIVEMTIEEFGKLAYREETHPVVEELYEELRRQCRPLDFWVRWTPNSFLLVLLDVTAEEAAGVVYRLRARMEQWWEQQPGTAFVPRVDWRYRTVGSLGASGDILRDVRSLLEPAQFVATPMTGVWQPKGETAPAAPPESDHQGRATQ